jgi:Protein of unknown function (DUF2829)
MERSLNFGQAVAALKSGKRVARDIWSRLDDAFIFMQVPSEIHKSIVPKMQSLPQSVKDEFERRFNDPKKQIDAIYYDNQVAIVYPSNLISGWAPSVEDISATDWYICD